MPNWNTDAQFATDLNPDFIFTNRRIDDFLSTNDRFIVVSAKGMGKTLLMRRKREIIQDEDPGVLLIPKNEAQSDYVALPENISRDFIRAMADAKFWQDLWQISIAISCLLHFPHRVTDWEKQAVFGDLSRSQLPDFLKDCINASFNGTHHSEYRPSAVLNILLQEKKSKVEQIRASSLHTVQDLFVNHISSACFVFIDSFDQAIHKILPNDLEIWCAAQSGLLRAAWELCRHNRHAKVFCTIRQEAYSSFSDAERVNIRGSTLIIEYSDSDLRQIFEKSIKHYEGLDNIADFVGFDSIHNGLLNLREDVFEYIVRHTIGVPRWLMVLGQEISGTRTHARALTNEAEIKKQEKLIVEIVNRVSSDELAREYIRGEMKIFFRKDDPEAFMANLSKYINSSVLSLSNLQMIADDFAKSGFFTAHPFCLLHNLGLVGYVGTRTASTAKQQIFKKPYEFDWNYDHILSNDPDTFYLIHPSMHHLIQKRNFKFRYSGVRIGAGLSWTAAHQKKIEKQIVKIFVSYAHKDWDKVEGVVKTIDRCLNEKSVLHDIWLDRWKMKSGKWFQDQIVRGLEGSEFLVFIISKNSLTSRPVTMEWKTKYATKFTNGDDAVLPFIIDDTPMDQIPKEISNVFCYQYEDDESRVVRLVDDILFWKQQKR